MEMSKQEWAPFLKILITTWPFINAHYLRTNYIASKINHAFIEIIKKSL